MRAVNLTGLCMRLGGMTTYDAVPRAAMTTLRSWSHACALNRTRKVRLPVQPVDPQLRLPVR